MTTEQEYLGNEKKCPTPELHGNPFRYCPNCDWIEPANTEPPPVSNDLFVDETGRIKVHKINVSKQKPSLGRVVLYKMPGQYARAINARREDAEMSRPGASRSGVMVHVGNRVQGGDVFPADIVRVWDDGHVNLQVKLDGNDTFWATSVVEGDEMGNYSWPPRV